jgi:hypothetical protein
MEKILGCVSSHKELLEEEIVRLKGDFSCNFSIECMFIML